METYYGHIRSPADAILLFEACRLGILPRVQRRLSEKERQSIRSGSVFVWDEREAGMRRWTDGKSWSASRVLGSFLTYREMEGKRGGHVASSNRGGKTPDSRGSGDDNEDGEEGPDGYRYKPDGLMKQSFSITTSAGQHLHLISYYARSHPTAPGLKQPTTDPALSHIRPQKGLYPESSVNDQQNLPAITRGPMPGAGYAIAPYQMPPQFGRPASATTHPTYLPSPYGWAPHPGPPPPSAPLPYAYGPPPPYLPPLSSNVPVQPNGQLLPPYNAMHPPSQPYIYAPSPEPRYVSPFPPVSQPPSVPPPQHHHHLPPPVSHGPHMQPSFPPRPSTPAPPSAAATQPATAVPTPSPQHQPPAPAPAPASAPFRPLTPTHHPHEHHPAPGPALAALRSTPPDVSNATPTAVPSISSIFNTAAANSRNTTPPPQHSPHHPAAAAAAVTPIPGSFAPPAADVPVTMTDAPLSQHLGVGGPVPAVRLQPQPETNGVSLAQPPDHSLLPSARPEAAQQQPQQQPPGAQDIPSEKIGFREDERALRQLDRVFI